MKKKPCHLQSLFDVALVYEQLILSMVLSQNKLEHGNCQLQYGTAVAALGLLWLKGEHVVREDDMASVLRNRETRVVVQPRVTTRAPLRLDGP
jgi:hypothetical protein